MRSRAVARRTPGEPGDVRTFGHHDLADDRPLAEPAKRRDREGTVLTRRSAWTAPLALIAVGAATAIAADFTGDVTAMILRASVGAVAVAAIIYGARRNQARPPVAWWVIAAGIGVWVAGDTIWDSLDIALADSGSNWYYVPNILYLIMYPALVWAIIKLVAAQRQKAGVERVIDSFLPALMLLLLVRVFLVDPAFSGSSVETAFNAAFPLGDALLLAGVTWLLFTPGMRNWSAWLLATGTATMLVADLLWDLQDRVSPDAWNSFINPLYPISYAIIGAAALHPSVGVVVERTGSDTHHERARLAMLCAALALIPVVALEADRNDVLIEALTATLVAAIGLRFITLVRALQRAQTAAHLSAMRFQSLVASVPVGILEADASATIVFSNHAIDALIGRSAVGMTAEELTETFIDPRDHEAVTAAIASVVDGRSSSAQMRIRGLEDVERWVAWYGAPVRDGSGRFAGAFSSMIEITPLKNAERVLALQATHDPLTALPNRRMLYDRLSTALARLNRQPGMVVVLFLDLDGFKAVNDSFGHDVGDDLLQVVAERLRSCVRADDVVARFGGDEFVIVLERVIVRTYAAQVAAKIIESVSAPITLEGAQRTVSVSASVGIASSANPADDPDALVRDSDAAMFEAKRAGRGTYRFFDPECDDAIDQRIRPGERLSRS